MVVDWKSVLKRTFSFGFVDLELLLSFRDFFVSGCCCVCVCVFCVWFPEQSELCCIVCVVLVCRAIGLCCVVLVSRTSELCVV